MRVYVASPFGEYRRARAAMQTIRSFGGTITHDWTGEVDRYPNDDAPPDVRIAHAKQDLAGVRAADVLLLLTGPNKAEGCGCWIEMGGALILGKRLVVTGPQRSRSIFCDLAEVVFEEDEDALAYLLAAGGADRSTRAELPTLPGDRS